MINDPKASHCRSRDQIKDELIAAQSKENTWLGLAAAGFATELLAQDWLPKGGSWRGPVIFGSVVVSLGGVVGDLYHGAQVHRLKRELQATTTLNHAPGH